MPQGNPAAYMQQGDSVQEAIRKAFTQSGGSGVRWGSGFQPRTSPGDARTPVAQRGTDQPRQQPQQSGGQLRANPQQLGQRGAQPSFSRPIGPGQVTNLPNLSPNPNILASLFPSGGQTHNYPSMNPIGPGQITNLPNLLRPASESIRGLFPSGGQIHNYPSAIPYPSLVNARPLGPAQMTRGQIPPDVVAQLQTLMSAGVPSRPQFRDSTNSFLQWLLANARSPLR